MDADLITRLGEFGLSQYESRCYVALLEEQPAKPYQIAKRAGVPVSKVYEVVARLAARGLVMPLQGDDEGYVPKAPDQALGEWRDRYLSTLDDVGQRLERVMAGQPTYMIWNTLQHAEVVAQGARLVARAARSVSACAGADLMGQWLDALTDARARGVSMRLIAYGDLVGPVGDLDVRILKPPANRHPRGAVLTVDGESVLFVSAAAPGGPLQGAWTDNPAIALVAEEYVEDKRFIEQAIENRWLHWGEPE